MKVKINQVIIYLFVLMCFNSCGLEGRDLQYDFLADSLVNNIDKQIHVILTNGIDGSGYYITKSITENKEESEKHYLQLADSVFSDSLKSSNQIPLLKILQNKFMNNEREVSFVSSEAIDTLQEIKGDEIIMFFSKEYSLSKFKKGGYLSVFNLKEDYKRGFFYEVSNRQFTLTEIWDNNHR